MADFVESIPLVTNTLKKLNSLIQQHPKWLVFKSVLTTATSNSIKI